MPEKPQPQASDVFHRQHEKTEIPGSSSEQPNGQSLLPGKSSEQTVRFLRKIASLFIVQHYPNMIAAGPNPQPHSRDDCELWVVPLVYASPSYGVVGDVGQLTINARSLEVVQSTPRNEAITRLKMLHYRNHRLVKASRPKATRVK